MEFGRLSRRAAKIRNFLPECDDDEDETAFKKGYSSNARWANLAEGVRVMTAPSLRRHAFKTSRLADVEALDLESENVSFGNVSPRVS
jgi:hypothetical protein